MALDGECGVNGRRWGSWGVSAGWPCLLLVVGGLDKLNGQQRRIVVNGGCGSDDRLRGGNPLWMADCLNDLDWCRLTWCRVLPGEDMWMGMVAVV